MSRLYSSGCQQTDSALDSGCCRITEHQKVGSRNRGSNVCRPVHIHMFLCGTVFRSWRSRCRAKKELDPVPKAQP